MKKLFFAFFALVALSASAQNDGTFNEPNAQKRTLNGSFAAIEVSDGIDLYLSQGNEESVAVSAADEKYLPYFKTEVVNGTLKLYYDRSGLYRMADRKKLKAWVSFKTLEKLHGSAGSEVTVKGSLELEKLDMKFTSGSEFNGKLTAKELVVTQNSGAEINMSGSTGKIRLDLSSGAEFNGYDLSVDYCDAEASSGAQVHIRINKELNARASSGGGIKYKGEGLIRDINISSGGLVKRA